MFTYKNIFIIKGPIPLISLNKENIDFSTISMLKKII